MIEVLFEYDKRNKCENCYCFLVNDQELLQNTLYIYRYLSLSPYIYIYIFFFKYNTIYLFLSFELSVGYWVWDTCGQLYIYIYSNNNLHVLTSPISLPCPTNHISHPSYYGHLEKSSVLRMGGCSHISNVLHTYIVYL